MLRRLSPSCPYASTTRRNITLKKPDDMEGMRSIDMLTWLWSLRASTTASASFSALRKMSYDSSRKSLANRTSSIFLIIALVAPSWVV